jgi:hypothetical protein
LLQGRNLTGSVGLFPVSYTAPAPAPAPSFTDISHPTEPVSDPPGLSHSNNRFVLQPLAEESESEAPPNKIISPVPKHPSTFFDNEYDIEPYENDASRDGANANNEVMKATMTDVQKAIEQLGRGGLGEDGDGARSFSFASTKDGANTENSDTDFDLSDFDGPEANGNNGEDWHKGARRKLAAKAKRAVEEAEKLEEMMGENGDGRRVIAPPIEAELSDESEPEDGVDFTRASNFQRNHPHIPEEDENIGTDGEAATTRTQYSNIDTLSTVDGRNIVPPIDENDVLTATKPSFSAPQSPLPVESLPGKPEDKSAIPEKTIYPSPVSPPSATVPNIQQVIKRSYTPVREITNGMPSPASVGHSSKRNSMNSSSSAPGMLMPGPQVQQQQQPNGTSALAKSASNPVPTAQAHNESPPTEWSIEDVVNWLKSKGFDQDICDKFIGEYIS